MRKSQGIFFVLSAPSGCGKTTLGNIILKEVPELTRSISHTTREKRDLEENGKDYFFVTQDEFEEMIQEDGLIEWERVHTNIYGTSKKSLRDLSQNSDLLLIIDYKGAATMKRTFPNETVTIFVIPPSFETLASRIKGEGDSRVDELEVRLQTAREELKNAHSFDYIVENNKLEVAAAEIQAIIAAERIKRDRKTQQIDSMIKA